MNIIQAIAKAIDNLGLTDDLINDGINALDRLDLKKTLGRQGIDSLSVVEISHEIEDITDYYFTGDDLKILLYDTLEDVAVNLTKYNAFVAEKES